MPTSTRFVMFAGTALVSLLLCIDAAWALTPYLYGRNGRVDVDELPSLTGAAPRARVNMPAPKKRDPGPGGTCGVTSQGTFTCLTDENKCCSAAGWCGDTPDHCGTGCQPAYGQCGIEPGSGACGPLAGNASCPTGQCCGSDSSCGTDVDHCEAPGCQEGFGSCQSDATPAGYNTSIYARPLVGKIPYGQDIYDCVNPGEIALTFDDGPDIYTDGMLDVLASYNAVASFMITGINNNKGEIDTTQAWIDVIKKQHAAGHQICSHTWAHQDLSLQNEWQRRNAMYKNEMAFINILGFWPTYMRPPYSSCTQACRNTMKALGYHIIYFDVDTDDYDNDSPTLIQNAKNNFAKPINSSNPKTDDFLVIAHDIHQQTAQNLTAYMLDTLLAKGYKTVTIGQCLGDPQENWYRFPDNATPENPDPTPTPTPLPSNCVYTIATWCATPLPTYSTIAQCWDSVGACYPQGDDCYNEVGGEIQSGCDAYETVCEAQEDHCDECATQAGDSDGPCAYLQPTYPASPSVS